MRTHRPNGSSTARTTARDTLRVFCVFAAAFFHCALIYAADSAREWTFDQTGDIRGWSVSPGTPAVVQGGALRLSLRPQETNPAVISDVEYQVLGDWRWASALTSLADTEIHLASPARLALDPVGGLQVQVSLQIRNLSPVTDMFLAWRSENENWKWSGKLAEPGEHNAKRCSIGPDQNQWQNVLCYIDPGWSSRIDQFQLIIPQRI